MLLDMTKEGSVVAFGCKFGHCGLFNEFVFALGCFDKGFYVDLDC